MIYKFITKLQKFLNTHLSFSYAVLRKYNLNGIQFKIYDYCYNFSCIADAIVRELKPPSYKIDQIQFKDGDIIIDIGGHVGIISIYLAKKYPFTKIYAFEPNPDNYHRFLRNLEINHIVNVEVYNKAITQDGRRLLMAVHHSNMAGATANLKNMRLPGHSSYTAESLTLDSIFEDHNIKKCKLLKIDCEGSEHEILLNTNYLDRIEYLLAEFHINEYLKSKGYSIEKLSEYCKKHIKNENIYFHCINMAE